MGRKSYVDIAKLARLVREKRAGQGIREASREIENVSPSTFSRVENERIPDLITFLALCDWVGVSPGDLIGPTPPINAQTIAGYIRLLEDVDPTSREALATLVEAIARKNGAESPD